MTQVHDLPKPQKRALELVKEVAVEKECRPFLVGGPVRDLILGRGSIDVDLTIEDGSSTFARALAKKVNGRVRSFPQFLTYKVTAEGLPEIDIATARKERYRKPGALPAVTAGKLKDDLLRRDFSINAIALDLLGGALHDPTGGEQDLHERMIRVLHDRSFIDDPTRIFRAIRLAARLDFAIEDNTARLMAEAIASGALETVSKERVWRELFLAMHEDVAPRVLTELAARGVLNVLFGQRASLPSMETLNAMESAVEADTDLDREALYTGALLRGDASPIDLEGSGFSQKRARKIVQIANELPRIAEELAAVKDDAEAFRLYDALSPEARCVISAENPAERPRLARHAEFRTFQIPLRGNDLEVPGGPHVARALERTREAVFTGEIPAEDARRFAKELVRRYLEERS
jgi:tRNA nucleotidyltransferase (CCA-adding enzyme)